MHPATHGATIVYNSYILPFYEEHAAEIEKMEKLAQEKL
jgi:hypothetical protein